MKILPAIVSRPGRPQILPQDQSEHYELATTRSPAWGLPALCDANFRVNQLAPEAVVVGLGGSKTQHHDCVACGTHEVVTFFDNLPILAVIEPKLLPPIMEMPEDFKSAGLHPRQHVHQASLDTD